LRADCRPAATLGDMEEVAAILIAFAAALAFAAMAWVGNHVN
jgi:HAMP domain-containing protein